MTSEEQHTLLNGLRDQYRGGLPPMDTRNTFFEAIVPIVKPMALQMLADRGGTIDERTPEELVRDMLSDKWKEIEKNAVTVPDGKEDNFESFLYQTMRHWLKDQERTKTRVKNKPALPLSERITDGKRNPIRADQHLIVRRLLSHEALRPGNEARQTALTCLVDTAINKTPDEEMSQATGIPQTSLRNVRRRAKEHARTALERIPVFSYQPGELEGMAELLHDSLGLTPQPDVEDVQIKSHSSNRKR